MTASISRAMAILMAITFLTAAVVYTSQAGNLHSTRAAAQIIEVEDLAAEYHTESSTITTSAHIKNISRSTLRGYAAIYFLSGDGQEIFSYEDEVNEGKAFADGSTVAFESTTRVNNVKKIVSISVDFKKR